MGFTYNCDSLWLAKGKATNTNDEIPSTSVKLWCSY